MADFSAGRETTIQLLLSRPSNLPSKDPKMWWKYIISLIIQRCRVTSTSMDFGDAVLHLASHPHPLVLNNNLSKHTMLNQVVDMVHFF